MSEPTTRPPFAARDLTNGTAAEDITYGLAAQQRFPRGELRYTNPSEDNVLRAGWGFATVTTLVETTYGGDAEFEPLGQVIGDLISYLHHLADAFGQDWEQILRAAEGHHEAEVNNLP